MSRRPKVLIVPANRSVWEAVRLLRLCEDIAARWPGRVLLDAAYFRETQRVLARGCEDIDEVVPLSNLKVNRPRHCWRTLNRSVPTLRNMRRHDMIVLLQEKSSHWPMSALARLTGAEVIDKHTRKGAVGGADALILEALAARLGTPAGTGDAGGPAIGLSGADKDWATDFFAARALEGQPTVFVNPYRASKHEGWGLRAYIQLAKVLSQRGVKVLMHEKGGPDERLGIGGINDRDEFDSQRAELESAGVVLAGNTSMTQLLALIDRCDITVGEPSGPIWIAAALGKPSVTMAPALTVSPASLLPAGGNDALHAVLVLEPDHPLEEDVAAGIVHERLDLMRGVRGGSLISQTAVVLNWVQSTGVGKKQEGACV